MATRSMWMHPHRPLFCTLLLSCSSSELEPVHTAADGAKFTEAIASVQAEPGRAEQICAPLADPALRGECLASGAEALAESQPDRAETLCGSVEAELEKDECYFQLAERSRQRDLCQQAGRFEEDCRMHFWSRELPSILAEDARPGKVEGSVQIQAAEHGFESGDPRPWVALYRHLLGRMRPLQRDSCGDIEVQERAEICRSTGMALFHDRLNHLRDTTGYPCTGEGLPESLNTRLDPDLEAALQQRLQEDLCP